MTPVSQNRTTGLVWPEKQHTRIQLNVKFNKKMNGHLQLLAIFFHCCHIKQHFWTPNITTTMTKKEERFAYEDAAFTRLMIGSPLFHRILDLICVCFSVLREGWSDWHVDVVIQRSYLYLSTLHLLLNAIQIGFNTSGFVTQLEDTT